MNTAVDTLADIVISAELLPLALFIGYYALLSPWKTTLVGKALMHQTVALGALLTIIVADIWFDYPWAEYVRLVVYSWMSISVWRMFLILRIYQQADFTSTYKN